MFVIVIKLWPPPDTFVELLMLKTVYSLICSASWRPLDGSCWLSEGFYWIFIDIVTSWSIFISDWCFSLISSAINVFLFIRVEEKSPFYHFSWFVFLWFVGWVEAFKLWMCSCWSAAEVGCESTPDCAGSMTPSTGKGCWDALLTLLSTVLKAGVCSLSAK